MDREAWHAAVYGVERVGHDWATELNWTKCVSVNPKLLIYPSLPLFLFGKHGLFSESISVL